MTSGIYKNNIGGRARKDYHPTEETKDKIRTHGMSNSKEFKSWVGAKGRAANPNGRYSHITICNDWKNSFESFYKYMGPIPSDGQRWSIDRIDNLKGYEPGNCRWATPKMQANNRRNNKAKI